MNMHGIYKISAFNRWMRKVRFTDQSLIIAIEEMKKGLIDADLGGGLVKKRIAISGQGKRGGARTIIATNKKDRWIFLIGFQKNERANISQKEEETLKQLAFDLLRLNQIEIEVALANQILMEVI